MPTLRLGDSRTATSGLMILTYRPSGEQGPLRAVGSRLHGAKVDASASAQERMSIHVKR